MFRSTKKSNKKQLQQKCFEKKTIIEVAENLGIAVFDKSHVFRDPCRGA